MAKIRGMFRRGTTWWLRYTPGPGLPQERVSLETHIEQLAAVKALAILHKPRLEKSSEFTVELEAYLEESQRLHKMSDQVVDNRRYLLTAFAEEFGVRRVSDITTSLAEKWVALVQAGGGGKGTTGKRRPVLPGTVASYLFHLRAFCGWLVKKHKIRENPAAKIELGKVETVVRKNFQPADVVRKLIAEAPDDDLRFVLFCGFHAGMRKLEIVEARPEWFRLGSGNRRGVITIHKTPTFSVKDRDEKSVPMSTEFEAFLRDYLARLPADAQFVLRPEVKHGEARYRYDFRRPFDDYMREMGVKCSPHDMRRTFVSNKILENSSLIFKLAKWTGTNVKTLQAHYAHLLADDSDIDVGLGEPVAPDLRLTYYESAFDTMLAKIEKLSSEIQNCFRTHVRERLEES